MAKTADLGAAYGPSPTDFAALLMMVERFRSVRADEVGALFEAVGALFEASGRRVPEGLGVESVGTRMSPDGARCHQLT